MPEGREARKAGSPATRRAMAIFLLALAVRILYIATLAPSGALAINEDPISDMETFHRWARVISEGDWLGREEFHPYHPWQRAIADEATWLRWYGPRVFHQDPLYPYFVALVYAAGGSGPFTVIVIQLILGACAAAGISLLAGRLASTRAAWIAGVLAALYAPFLFYESLLLRDTLLVLLCTLFLLLLEEARRRPSALPWLACGAAAGLIYLTKPNIVVLLPLLAIWIWWSGEAPRPARAVAALVAGLLLAISPAVARNLAVGAPPFKTTTRGPIAFINGNNPWHVGTGWFDGDDPRVSAYARSIMMKSEGRLLPTVGQVLEGWRGDPTGWAGLQFRKLGYLLAPYEIPNNASFSYFRLNSPVLALGLPTFYAVSPLAALGLVAALGRWRRWMPHLLFLATGILVTVAFYVIARFRTPFLPLVLVLAGAGADRLLSALQERKAAPIAVAVGVVAGLLAVNTAVDLSDRSLVRPQDYAVAAAALADRGEPARAAAELEAGLEIFPDSFPLRLEAARAWEQAGDLEAALGSYRRALELNPGAGAGIRREIRRLEARPAGGRPEP